MFQRAPLVFPRAPQVFRRGLGFQLAALVFPRAGLVSDQSDESDKRGRSCGSCSYATCDTTATHRPVRRYRLLDELAHAVHAHDARMWLVLAERLFVTGTMTGSMGSIDAGPHDGYTLGGHFDLGVTLARFRVAAEFDAGQWSYEDAPDDKPESGSFTRLGGSLRYYFMDIDIARQDEAFSLVRMYIEAGTGTHTIDAPSVAVTRRDVSFGFGTQQQADLSGMTLGATFGIRAVIAEAPAPSLACRGTCDGSRRHDIAVFFSMGFAVGK